MSYDTAKKLNKIFKDHQKSKYAGVHSVEKFVVRMYRDDEDRFMFSKMVRVINNPKWTQVESGGDE